MSVPANIVTGLNRIIANAVKRLLYYQPSVNKKGLCDG